MDKKVYETPMVEMFEIEAEQGFSVTDTAKSTSLFDEEE